MAEYLVNQKATSEEAGHQVHLLDCGEIKQVNEFKYLGSYGNSEAAFKKAAGYYHPVSFCPSCLSGA